MAQLNCNILTKMKIYTKLVIPALAACLFSCTEPVDNNPADFTFTIEADKDIVEADGKDAVTFRVITDDGTVLSETESRSVRIQEVGSGKKLPMKTFSKTSLWNSDEEFVATYKDKQSTNSVKVSFCNREKYEKYHQNVVVTDVTGTWCVACPTMTTALEGVERQYARHMIVLAMHVGDDPFLPVNDNNFGLKMLEYYNRNVVPTCIYDLYEISNTNTSAGIANEIHNYITNYPATCGVRIESSSLTDNTLKIKAAMTSTVDGKYSMAWAMVTDGNVYMSGTLPSGIYDDVVVAVSDNFYKMTSASTFDAKAGEEVVKEFEMKINSNNISQNSTRIVVIVNRKADNKQEIMTDNAAVCPLGESIGYKLN